MSVVFDSTHCDQFFTYIKERKLDQVAHHLSKGRAVSVQGTEAERVEQIFAQVLGEMKQREEISYLEVYAVAQKATIPPCSFFLKEGVFINVIYDESQPLVASLEAMLQKEICIRDYPLRQAITECKTVYVWDCEMARFHIVIEKMEGLTKFYFGQEGYHGSGQIIFTKIREWITPCR